MPIYIISDKRKENIMELHSTWTGTYSFVFELKALLKSFRAYIDTVLRKIEYVEARIEDKQF